MTAWVSKRLSEVTSKIGSGATPLGGEAAYKQHGIALIRSLNVHDGEFRLKDLAFLDQVQASRLDNVVVESDDILLNITGASVARCCLVPEVILPARVNQHVAIVRPLQNFLLPKFLQYMLVSRDCKDRLLHTGESAGSTRQALTKAQLQDFVVRFPESINEQRRIVTLLDEAFADIATAKANAEKNLQNAEALFQSQLTTLFNRPAKNAARTTIGQATGGVFTGPFGSLLHKQDYVENGIPLVNPAHISQNGIEPDQRKTVSNETAQRLANYIMRAGDIVIGRRGEMGRCALITAVEDGWLCGTGSFFIKPSPRCDAGYLVHLLRSDQCKKQLEKIAGGAVMPNLSNTDLSNFALELPPVEDQKQIVKQIELAKQEVENLKSIYRQKLTVLDDLKKSLLHQAFSGQLS